MDEHKMTKDAAVATNDTSNNRVDETEKQRHEQEPLAWFRYETFYEYRNQLARCTKDCIGAFPVYTSPPKREWQGLTDDELHAVIRSGEYDSMEDFARAIEAKLKAKNGFPQTEKNT